MAGPPKAESQDLVADRELGDVGTHSGHHTGKVTALAGREGGRKHLMHRTDPDAGLAGVDPRGANLDQDLARAGRRHLDVRHIQHLTAPVTVELYGTRN